MPYYPPQKEQEPRDDAPRGRGLTRRVLLCACALAVVYGAVRLAGYGLELVSARRTTQEMREIAAETEAPAGEAQASEAALPEAPAAPETALPEVSPAPETARIPEAEKTPEAAPVAEAHGEAAPGTEGGEKAGKLPAVEYPNGYDLVPRIQKLRKKSQYVIGWLTMDDLDEPVVQKDNVFFLNHDAAGRRNSNGAIFMDETTGLLTRPYTVFLYGHNMKTGAMFGNLRKYEDYAYCFRHRKIKFDTLYEEGQYLIFAVETISLTPGKSRYVNLAALESTDRETRRKALKALKNGSVHDLLTDVDEEDQVLLLVTCVGDDDERLLVAARRTREGE